MQVSADISPGNYQVKPLFDELVMLITTTKDWDVSSYYHAGRLMNALLPFRDLDEHYFVEK
jgi:hypothetical protein